MGTQLLKLDIKCYFARELEIFDLRLNVTKI